MRAIVLKNDKLRNIHNKKIHIYISVYLETGGMTPAATFTISTNPVANNNRMWNVSKQDSKPSIFIQT